MLTRNNRYYVPGYYKRLNDNKLNKRVISESEKNKNNRIENKKKSIINIDNLIKLINFNILSRLKSTRKGSPTIKLKFVIDNKIFKFLKESYGFNSRFKENDEFLLTNKIETLRCRNQRYYSSASQFEFRLNKGRKLKFCQINEEKKVVSREITSSPTFSISFFMTNFP